MCGYFPMDSEKDEPIIESVSGTHAAPDMMAYLVFNRFFLDTPVYRETARLLQERMRLSRQTVTNWLEKGSQFFKGVIEYLKDQCLEKDSVVNCVRCRQTATTCTCTWTMRCWTSTMSGTRFSWTGKTGTTQ